MFCIAIQELFTSSVPLCALFVARPTSVEHSSTYNRSGKHWHFLITVLHRHPGIVYRQYSLCAVFVAKPTSVEHSSTYNRSGKHWYFLIHVLHRHPGIVYRQRSPSVPCVWPGQHLSNTVRSITELPGRTAFKWWGVWDHQPVVRLFGGDPGGTRNGPAVPSPRGTWWSPPDCLSTSSAALGRCVSRRATTTTGQHRLLTAPGLPSAHAHWRNRASRS